jgi:hypothetical protein
MLRCSHGGGGGITVSFWLDEQRQRSAAPANRFWTGVIRLEDGARLTCSFPLVFRRRFGMASSSVDVHPARCELFRPHAPCMAPGRPELTARIC